MCHRGDTALQAAWAGASPVASTTLPIGRNDFSQAEQPRPRPHKPGDPEHHRGLRPISNQTDQRVEIEDSRAVPWKH